MSKSALQLINWIQFACQRLQCSSKTSVPVVNIAVPLTRIKLDRACSCCNLYKAYIFVHRRAPEYLSCNDASPGMFSSNWSTACVVIWLHMLRSRCVRLRLCFARSRILLSVMLSHLDASSASSRWRWIATKDRPMSVTEVHPLNVRCSRVWRFSATSASPPSVTCNKNNFKINLLGKVQQWL